METRRDRCLVMLAALLPALFLSSWALAEERASLPSEGQALLREKTVEATRAGVPESDVAGIIERAVGRGVPAPEIARLLDVVTEARRQDLPVGPLLDKVKEGLAKGAPPERIVAVASRISGDLATSRDLIRRAEREGVRGEGRGDRERVVESVADAMGRGVSLKDVEELARRVAGSSPRGATLSRLEAGAQATADLVSMGLPLRDASETVGVALSHDLDRREIERLRESLARERRRGGSLEDGARRIRDEILSGRGEHQRGRDRERDRDRGRDRGGSGGRDGGGGGKSGPH